MPFPSSSMAASINSAADFKREYDLRFTVVITLLGAYAQDSTIQPLDLENWVTDQIADKVSLGQYSITDGTIVAERLLAPDLQDACNVAGPAEGWKLVNFNNWGLFQIQKDPNQGVFSDNAHAVSHCRALAASGSSAHAFAITAHDRDAAEIDART